MNESIGKLKKEYLNVEPDALMESGWQSLEVRIDRHRSIRRLFTFLVILSTVFLLTSGTLSVQMAKAALPGELLYPLKRTSEKVVIIFNKDRNIPIENRVQEIVGLVEKEERLEKENDLRQEQIHSKILETVGEYSQEVLEVKEDSGSSDNFQNRLDSHRGKFESLIKQHPTCAKELEQAIEVTKSGQNGDSNSGGSGSSGGGKD